MLTRFKHSVKRYSSSSDGDSSGRERGGSAVLLGSPRASPTGPSRGASAMRAAPWAEDNAAAGYMQGVSVVRVDKPRQQDRDDETESGCSIVPFLNEEATAAALAAVESPKASASHEHPATPVQGVPRAYSGRAWDPAASQSPSAPAAGLQKSSSMGSHSPAKAGGGSSRVPSQVSRDGSSCRNGLPPPHPGPATMSMPRTASTGSASLHETEAEHAGSPAAQAKLLPLAHVEKKLSLNERVYMEESVSLSRSSVKAFQSEEATAAALEAEASPASAAASQAPPAPWAQDLAAPEAGGTPSARPGGSAARAWTLNTSRVTQPLQAGDSSTFGAQDLQAGDSSKFNMKSKSSRALHAPAPPPAQADGGSPGPAAEPAPRSARRRPKSATQVVVAGAEAAAGVFHAMLRRASFGGSSKVLPVAAGGGGGGGDGSRHAAPVPAGMRS